MADWGYVLAGFGLMLAAVAFYAVRIELRIHRLRSSRRGADRS